MMLVYGILLIFVRQIFSKEICDGVLESRLERFLCSKIQKKAEESHQVPFPSTFGWLSPSNQQILDRKRMEFLPNIQPKVDHPEWKEKRTILDLGSDDSGDEDLSYGDIVVLDGLDEINEPYPAMSKRTPLPYINLGKRATTQALDSSDDRSKKAYKIPNYQLGKRKSSIDFGLRYGKRDGNSIPSFAMGKRFVDFSPEKRNSQTLIDSFALGRKKRDVSSSEGIKAPRKFWQGNERSQGSWIKKASNGVKDADNERHPLISNPGTNEVQRHPVLKIRKNENSHEGLYKKFLAFLSDFIKLSDESRKS